jgi:TRAP-type mannitol/chloroaromatic compound transport system permease large subunit
MSGGEVGLMMISLFIITVLLGFPIVFTLMGMAVLFGYYAYAPPDWYTICSFRTPSVF